MKQMAETNLDNECKVLCFYISWYINTHISSEAAQWGLKRWLYLQHTGETASRKKGVLGMTLNCMWWWGSTFGALDRVEYLYIVITPRSIDSECSTCWCVIICVK